MKTVSADVSCRHVANVVVHCITNPFDWHVKSIVAAIHAKMDVRTELLDSTGPVPLDDNPEPERKRLKKIDFRYTT